MGKLNYVSFSKFMNSFSFSATREWGNNVVSSNVDKRSGTSTVINGQHLGSPQAWCLAKFCLVRYRLV